MDGDDWNKKQNRMINDAFDRFHGNPTGMLFDELIRHDVGVGWNHDAGRWDVVVVFHLAGEKLAVAIDPKKADNLATLLKEGIDEARKRTPTLVLVPTKEVFGDGQNPPLENGEIDAEFDA